MSPHELKELLKHQPFEGLRICISDGQSYEVRHPDMVLVTSRVIHIAKPPMDGDVPSGGTVYVDPIHITRIEPLNGEKRARFPRKR
ncbi:MAG: hypothetical protein Q7R41_17300 [Phycisphaerales bacterium]|nr:hypothetical protein [Phycisphaerales bacterium]